MPRCLCQLIANAAFILKTGGEYNGKNRCRAPTMKR